MIKAGKKTKEWDETRAELKKEFAEAGITTCEIRKEKICWYDNALSFAHTKKRRNTLNKLDPEEHKRLLKRVVLACIPCHNWVESLGEEKMEEILEGIIKGRKTSYNSEIMKNMDY